MRKHLYHIDGLRFLLSIIIVYYHILHANVFSYLDVDIPLLNTLQSKSTQAGLVVECFLIIGGYFLYRSYQKNPEKTFIEYALNRFFRLWPVLALSVVLMIASGHETLYDGIFDLLFFRSTGISLSNTGIIWYIGPFFWCSLLLFALLKTLKPQPCTLVLTILVWLAYSVNINMLDGDLGREVIYGFLSLSMCRVFAGLGVGILTAIAMDSAGKHFRPPIGYRRTSIFHFSGSIPAFLPFGLFSVRY